MSLDTNMIRGFDIDRTNAETFKIDPKEYDKRMEPDFFRNDVAKEDHSYRIGNFENPTYYRTLNESLEKDLHPITGVPFEKRIIETPSGEVIEGVFPKFESKFKAKISENLYLERDRDQFKECNRQLLDRIESTPDFKKQFTDEQIEQIREGVKDGSAPDGYVWHHEPESGELSLVDSEVHAKTSHTGGRKIWGGGSDFR